MKTHLSTSHKSTAPGWPDFSPALANALRCMSALQCNTYVKLAIYCRDYAPNGCICGAVNWSPREWSTRTGLSKAPAACPPYWNYNGDDLILLPPAKQQTEKELEKRLSCAANGRKGGLVSAMARKAKNNSKKSKIFKQKNSSEFKPIEATSEQTSTLASPSGGCKLSKLLSPASEIEANEQAKTKRNEAPLPDPACLEEIEKLLRLNDDEN